MIFPSRDEACLIPALITVYVAAGVTRSRRDRDKQQIGFLPMQHGSAEEAT